MIKNSSPKKHAYCLVIDGGRRHVINNTVDELYPLIVRECVVIL